MGERLRRGVGVAGVFAALCGAAGALGQDRQSVALQLSYNQTQVGQSVFVLGSLPELGGGDVTRAVKLEPTQWPLWKGMVSLPAGRSFTYQFYRRSDGPGTLGSTSGTAAIGSVLAGSTVAGVPAPEPERKAVVCMSGFAVPVVFWREAGSGAGYSSRAMTAIGAGRNSAERRWAAWELTGSGGEARRTVEFYFADGAGTGRDPAGVGTYSTALDAPLVQDGGVFGYAPAASVGAQRRDYAPASPPALVSSNLGGESRPYRVLLPRGYDQQGTRRYPVLYMHDGQNIFEQGPFGTWHADTTLGDLVKRGQVREVIVVGVDNTANRYNNYVTPDDAGQADRYVRFVRDELRPFIDSRYRTLTGAENTGALGSSLGGVVSLYMGWDFTGSFGRIGAMSGSWQLANFPARVMAQGRREMRLYMDSGDSGTSSDNYWLSFNLRDNLMAKSPGYVLEGDLRHRVGLGQQHNEAAWAARLPDALTFLFPATEGVNPLDALASGRGLDVDGDGRVDVEDLYRAVGGPPGTGSADLNQDGVVDGWDAVTLGAYVRRGEGAGMVWGR